MPERSYRGSKISGVLAWHLNADAIGRRSVAFWNTDSSSKSEIQLDGLGMMLFDCRDWSLGRLASSFSYRISHTDAHRKDSSTYGFRRDIELQRGHPEGLRQGSP
jgi:hypothetical protein